MKTTVTARLPGLVRGLLAAALLCICGCGGPSADDGESAALRRRVHELERQVEELVLEERLLRAQILPVPEIGPERRKKLSTRELVAATMSSLLNTMEGTRDQLAILQVEYSKIRAELEALKKR
jgi:hypothetical protein